MIYKITNITDSLNKRDINFNKPIELTYTRGFLQRTEIVRPKDFIYLVVEGKTLPNSVQKNKLRGLIIVEEANHVDLYEDKPKPQKKKTVKKTKKSTKSTKKTKKT
ncbi:MAG: hypothetical protein ACOCVF_00355 [bacterium]